MLGLQVEHVLLLHSLAVSDLRRVVWKFCLTAIGPCYIGIYGSKSDRHGRKMRELAGKVVLLFFLENQSNKHVTVKIQIVARESDVSFL
jgi:hypothetical protein